MEEKIIIKGTPDKMIKKIKIVMIALFAVALFLFVFLAFPIFEDSYYSFYYDRYIYENFSGYYAGLYCEYALPLILFILACCSILFAIVCLIFYFATKKCSIIVTETSVKGTAPFGKEVVLPLYMVSSYSTRKLFSTIAVSTGSGITKFLMIENYQEIGNVLARLISERQEKTTLKVETTSQQNNSFDEILKLKELLDKGVITQEEFDTKKKQILGL